MSEIKIFEAIMDRNDSIAAGNSAVMAGALSINMMSSPGAGKTTLLEMTLKELGKKYRIGIIEGDIATSNDAKRVKKYARSGDVFQIKTENFGGGCHLDAKMVSIGLKKIGVLGKRFDAIIIENVGNLICPADFRLGEDKKVVMLSVTEGDDKPLKYPGMFEAADLVILNKTDLLRYANFSMKKARVNIHKVNRKALIIEMSAYKKKNIKKWYDTLAQWIREKKEV